MPTVTSVPGVYIEEDASPAMSVSQLPTSIPLFIGRFKPLNNGQENTITRINSWLEYSTLFDANCSVGADVKITSKLIDLSPDPLIDTTSEEHQVKDTSNNFTSYIYTIDSIDIESSTASQALQLYFQNGGGTCYIYPLELSDSEAKFAGLPELVDEVEDITLLVCSELDKAFRAKVYQTLGASLEQHKGYFLLADSHDGSVPNGLSRSAHAALYYPDIVKTEVSQIGASQVAITGYQDKDETTITNLDELQTVNASLATKISKQINALCPIQLLISPSSLMAAVYCKTDRERGVWKAPANVTLNGVSHVSVRVTDDEQGTMNLAGINVIRHFSDRGIVVWGARTLEEDDNWRYIPVRRLFDTVQRDVKKSLRSMVFEPNSQPTWKRAQAAINNYLFNLWQQGGLAGDKAEQAYFVRVGKDITMTQDDIDQGKMIIQVGMAAVRPAEFIILQFTQEMSQ